MGDTPDALDRSESESASGTLDRATGGACCEGQLPANRVASDEIIEAEQTVFKALANEKRLRIIEALRDGELCVCDLEAVLDVPQSTVASHLARLREAGIVGTRKDGKWTHYRITDTLTLQMLDLAAALGDGE
ncbi:Transcriptional regulator containing HTH domain,ArsR family [Halanaeroarchaeum sp. HSR-CO]|uniref:ArsR/SmtB family transcription factor n=1 Tax=Halanaeroarchaeum sp. HSR-CO TaxID=2866382 RepID=UPI00217F174D|nr:metalloregulator ArsR/SmtB family transcription factor [Halanaeroarchaeum sp. HSR-CO]UWG47074.1 Transcriptional regulator containing HTH domain,ArsR family [Halanaeroarchaeum sp. HSR-CO]